MRVVIFLVLTVCQLEILRALESRSRGGSFHNNGICEATRFCESDAPCPFDDLSVAEIQSVMSIILQSGYFPISSTNFPIIRTQEPRKSDWNSGKQIPRIAYSAIWNTASNTLSEVLVNLDKGKITKITQLPNQLPRRMAYEIETTSQIVMDDWKWRSAMSRRSLRPEYSRIVAQMVGSSGYLLNTPGSRIMKALTYYADKKTSVWGPVEGLVLTVDLNREQVIEFEDTESTNLTSPINTDPNLFSQKPPLKPIVISQPMGTSIQVRGHEIKWYKWTMRYGVDPIHGLQLYHIRYQSDCEDRLVLYKISLGEMYVPYGAKGSTWRWRGFFDAGEVGIGLFANPLQIGTDLPENAILLDCVMADETGGAPQVVRGCVGAYERNTGMLYKHTDLPTGVIEARRGRKLVLTLVTTIGNYDYAFDYIFKMDGVIEVKVRLTGDMVPRGVKQAKNDPSCLEDCIQYIGDYIIAPTHQHFFNYRIDFDVDGPNNYVMQVDVVNELMGPDNPDGGAFSPRKKIIEYEGYRNYNIATSRTWQVGNANSRNKFGTVRAYALQPVSLASSFLQYGNPILKQAAFAKEPIWITAYKDEEQSSGGNSPRSGIPGQGLPKYIQDKQSLKNVDSVLWYTFGVTHTTRPEDWPIMNVHQGSFLLIPYSFQSQNSEAPLVGSCP